MIEGVGIDSVEVSRMETLISKGNLFRDRAFTPLETDYCLSQGHSAQSFAARFAAKEAFVKALGTGFSGDLDFLQIEVSNKATGQPQLSVSGAADTILKDRKIKTIHLSLTHTNTIATAIVILEK